MLIFGWAWAPLLASNRIAASVAALVMAEPEAVPGVLPEAPGDVLPGVLEPLVVDWLPYAFESVWLMLVS